mmetsp:Transcript_4100/g.6155  ORF Transcript_4100/g.6155 Transcript_4100/m.6155 type:complete len:288 (-) Transcript_4100:17-880(-)
MSSATEGEKLLRKLGWSQDEGLGKNGDGIKSHLRATLTTTKRGVGAHDGAWEHWWEDLYDKKLKTETKKSKKRTKKKKRHSSSSRKRQTKPVDDKFLGLFVAEESVVVNDHQEEQKKTQCDRSGSSLTSSSDSDSDDDDAFEAQIRSSLLMGTPNADKKLFAACEQRTARSYDPKGKLHRLREQEKQLMVQLNSCDKTTKKVGKVVIEQSKKNERSLNHEKSRKEKNEKGLNNEKSKEMKNKGKSRKSRKEKSLNNEKSRQSKKRKRQTTRRDKKKETKKTSRLKRK